MEKEEIEYRQTKVILESMNEKQLLVTMVLYLKDIKNRLDTVINLNREK